jgi:hypothetical protein
MHDNVYKLSLYFSKAIIQNIAVAYFILSAIILESLQSAKLKITSCIPSFLESAEEKYCRDWLLFSQQ